MKYYRVFKKFDGVQILKTNRWGRLYVDRELIGNELYTPAELRKILNGATLRGPGVGNCTQVFEPVEIKKTEIYWFFGARFGGGKGAIYENI